MEPARHPERASGIGGAAEEIAPSFSYPEHAAQFPRMQGKLTVVIEIAGVLGTIPAYAGEIETP